MPNIFFEKLSPLKTRSSHVRNLEVLRVSSQLDGDDYAVATNFARKEVLKWARKRAGGCLPEQAWDFEDFDLPIGGRNCAAVRFKSNGADIWALRVEDPDRDFPGRTWLTEVVIGGQSSERSSLSARLIVSTEERKFLAEPHVPGLILQIAEAPGLLRSGRKLLAKPQIIDTENNAQDLCDLLEDSERRLPVIVITLLDDGTSLIDDNSLARAVTGLARVVRVSSEMTWVLTNRFGKLRSVFGGAVRVYMSGFSVTDDPRRHRLFVSDRLKNGAAAECSNWLRKTVAQLSISGTRLGQDVVDFASVTTASRRLKAEERQTVKASAADQIAALMALNESLEEKINNYVNEINDYVNMVDEADNRARTSEQEYRSLLYRYRHLEEELSKGSASQTEEPPLPQSWSEFVDWLCGTYSSRVILTPAARRMLRSSPAFEDVGIVAQAVKWLASEHYERRTKGGGSVKNLTFMEDIQNSPCGSDSYEVKWRDCTYTVDWHVKTGGNTRDPKKCLRIYYFWEPDDNLTVIDHLPGHRKTAAS